MFAGSYVGQNYTANRQTLPIVSQNLISCTARGREIMFVGSYVASVHYETANTSNNLA